MWTNSYQRVNSTHEFRDNLIHMKNQHDYLLGTDDEELTRLGFQHRVWAQYAQSLWERAGFSTGQTILDAGCGPGFATLDLSTVVGPSGKVIAFDESEKFINHLNHVCTKLEISTIETKVCDVQSMDIPNDSLDGAFARWVLCFVHDPEAVIHRVSQALKPGGVFAVQDYFNYEAFTLAPRSQAMDRVVKAVIQSWQQKGGNVNIAGSVPAMMQRCGLEVREISPIVRVARPGSALWDWPTTFFRNFLPVLVQMGLLTDLESEAFLNDWHEREKDPNAFFMSPPIFDIIGVKK